MTITSFSSGLEKINNHRITRIERILDFYMPSLAIVSNGHHVLANNTPKSLVKTKNCFNKHARELFSADGFAKTDFHTFATHYKWSDVYQALLRGAFLSIIAEFEGWISEQNKHQRKSPATFIETKKWYKHCAGVLRANKVNIPDTLLTPELRAHAVSIDVMVLIRNGILHLDGKTSSETAESIRKVHIPILEELDKIHVNLRLSKRITQAIKVENSVLNLDITHIRILRSSLRKLFDHYKAYAELNDCVVRQI